MSHPGSYGFSIYLSPGEATPSKLPAPEHIRRDPVFLQLLIKRRFRDRENFTRRRYASAMSSQLLNDDLLLEQVHQFGRRARGALDHTRTHPRSVPAQGGVRSYATPAHYRAKDAIERTASRHRALERLVRTVAPLQPRISQAREGHPPASPEEGQSPNAQPTTYNTDLERERLGRKDCKGLHSLR